MEKDKYDNQRMKDINPNKLYKDICEEAGILATHLDILQAILPGSEDTLKVVDAMDKIDEVCDMLAEIKSAFPTENILR